MSAQIESDPDCEILQTALTCFMPGYESIQTDIKTFTAGCVKSITQEQDEKDCLIMFRGCLKGIGTNGGAPV